MDNAHTITDMMLLRLEKKIGKMYTALYASLRKRFLHTYGTKDLTKKILHSPEWINFEKSLAKTISQTNLLSADMIRALMPKVYSFNANYAMYEIEKGYRIRTAFNLVDEATVKELIQGRRILPVNLNIAKDLRWNRQQIHGVVLRGIIKGQTNKDIAKLFRHIVKMDENAAIRNARTATTSAECAGRIYTYEQAENLGIKLMQEWQATLDGRTRHEHRELDGQQVPVGESFHVDGYEIKYPGDPDAEPEMIYNCRCTVVAAIKGIDNSKNERLTTMEQSYDEWKAGKQVTYGEMRDING